MLFALGIGMPNLKDGIAHRADQLHAPFLSVSMLLGAHFNKLIRNTMFKLQLESLPKEF